MNQVNHNAFLITGASGYLGRNLIEKLAQNTSRNFIILKRPSSRFNFRVDTLKKLRFIILEIFHFQKYTKNINQDILSTAPQTTGNIQGI